MEFHTPTPKNNIHFFTCFVKLYFKHTKNPKHSASGFSVIIYFTASFKALPALNAGVVVAGIEISLPV